MGVCCGNQSDQINTTQLAPETQKKKLHYLSETNGTIKSVLKNQSSPDQKNGKKRVKFVDNFDNCDLSEDEKAQDIEPIELQNSEQEDEDTGPIDNNVENLLIGLTWFAQLQIKFLREQPSKNQPNKAIIDILTKKIKKELNRTK